MTTKMFEFENVREATTQSRLQPQNFKNQNF